MSLYDVVMEVTYRIDAADQDDAALQVHLSAQEALFGGVIINPPGESEDAWRRRVDARTAQTGISLRRTLCERVVTPKPYDVGQA